jgi:hypothetical protein
VVVSHHALNFWFNAKNITGQVPRIFAELFEALKKTTLLPNTRDNTINFQMAINQGIKVLPKVHRDVQRL